MNTDFHCYVSHGSPDKLKSYFALKKTGTVIIYKYTSGVDSGCIIMLQITKQKTLESARTITLSRGSIDISKQIKIINYNKHR